MVPQAAVAVGLFSLAWIVIRSTFKRTPKPKILSGERPLTVREPDELSILSYNVLADNIAQSNTNYNYVDDLYRSWEYRFDKLKEHISAMNADIVCLQEVETKRWLEWRDFMDELGYTGVLLKRAKPQKKRTLYRACTVATFFRSRRFTMCWEEHCNRVLGVGVKWLSAGGHEKKLYTVNVHLEGDPYKPDERVRQVNAILRRMEKDQAKCSDESDIVFCGDFNGTRGHAPWNYLYYGRLDAGFTEPYYPDIPVVNAATEHPFPLIDVYKKANATPPFTIRVPRRRVETDFIFASRHLKVAGVLRAINPYLLPYVDRSCLPNKLFPSDHLPIGVVLLQSKRCEVQPTYQEQTSCFYSEVESAVYEGAAGSICSDSANNTELHGSVESLNVGIHAGMPLRKSSGRFMNDTALVSSSS